MLERNTHAGMKLQEIILAKKTKYSFTTRLTNLEMQSNSEINIIKLPIIEISVQMFTPKYNINRKAMQM
jgi:hypothetical protein